MHHQKKITLGIIFGGESGEHEVSLMSARSVIAMLNKNKYEVFLIGISKNGQWLFGFDSLSLYKKNEREFLRSILQKSKKINSKKTPSPLLNFLHETIDVAFPIIHGTTGEDGTIQGIFELARIPYVGSGVLGSALGMDKVAQKELYKFHKIPQTRFLWFYSREWKNNREKILKQIKKNLRFPLFIKPANLGSSVGITKVKKPAALQKAIALASLYDTKILVEEGILNIHEVECSVLGNYEPVASSVGEIIPSNEFYDYNAKYIDNKTQLIIPAKLPKNITQNIQKYSIRAFTILNLFGMSRVDFFVKKNTKKIFINEVNTIPGFTLLSMYPKLWEASGLTYSVLLDSLIHLALQRHSEKLRLKTTFEPQ